MSCPVCGAHSIICGACGNCLSHCKCGPAPGPSCNTVRGQTSDGQPFTAIICTRGQRRHNCEFCSRYATKQCDFPVIRNGKETTCDRWMCDGCATVQGPNLDYCPPHERNKVKIMAARALGTCKPIMGQPGHEGHDKPHLRNDACWNWKSNAG
jgi:hypothetical protein